MFAILLLAMVQPLAAHSWVDRVSLVFKNGTRYGYPGYIRGYEPRLPGYDVNVDDVYLLPPNDGRTPPQIYSNDMMCKPSQLAWNYTVAFPPLKVTSGSRMTMQYVENGHVTIPQDNGAGKKGPGLVFVYGAPYSEEPDFFNQVHKVWNVQGTSGRGRLLTVTSFDDGKCYQYSTISSIAMGRAAEYSYLADPTEMPDLWCNTYVKLPDDWTSQNVYTLYWVWDWPSVYGGGVPDKPEVYTSCLDVQVI